MHFERKTLTLPLLKIIFIKTLKIFFAAKYEGCGVFSLVPPDDGRVLC